jgi:hypothetical protein
VPIRGPVIGIDLRRDGAEAWREIAGAVAAALERTVMGHQRLGCALLVRSDPRLAAATLASLRQQQRVPDHLVVLVPIALQHAFGAAPLSTTAGLIEQSTRCIYYDTFDNVRALAVRNLADQADLAVLVGEGAALHPSYLATLAAYFASWDDAAALLDLSDQQTSVDAKAADWNVPFRIRPPGAAERLLRVTRPRSLMQCVLAFRMVLARAIAMPNLDQSCDWACYAAVLSQLRRRGHTAARFTDLLHTLRPHPDLRRPRPVGHALYHAAGRSPEIVRLFLAAILDELTSPASRSPGSVCLADLMAARRHAKRQQKLINRDLRDLAN